MLTPFESTPDCRPMFEELEPRLLLSSGADLSIWQQNYSSLNEVITAELQPGPPSELPGNPQLMDDPPPVPDQPDLVDPDDSGVSDTDNLTNVTMPTICIEASDPGLSVKIYRSGVYLGDAMLLSGTTFEYTFSSGQLQEGENVITARTFDGSLLSGDSAALTITLDTVAPIVPHIVGNCETPGSSYGVAVAGSLAFVADYASGLQIIDISTPSSPMVVGTYDTPGYAYGVAVVGTLAYVADGSSGLQIIDVSTPSAPTLMGNCDTYGTAYAVTVEGTLAYLASKRSGLQIIDVSTPSAPTEVGSYNTSGYAYGVTVSGSLAYVADSFRGMKIIDISTPSSPTQVGSYSTAGYVYGVTVVGSLAYVAAYSTGLDIVDISTPSAPTRVGRYDAFGTGMDVVVVGSLAYVAGYSTGLQIIDISTPSAPTLAGCCDTPGSARDVVIAGSLAYVADYSTGLQVIEVATPSAPVLDLAYSSDTGPYTDDNITDDTTPTFNLAASGPYARIYRDGVQTSGDFEVTPVTLPDQPYGTFDYTARAVDAAGNLSTLSDPLSVNITVFPPTPLQPDLLSTFDSGVSDSDNITNVTTPIIWIESGDPSLPMEIYRDGVYLGNATFVSGTSFEYAFGPGELQEGDNLITARTIDGLVPSNDSPTLTITVDTVAPVLVWSIGSYDTTGTAYASVVVGNLAYVADGTHGLQILDVSDPSSPTRLSTYNTPDTAYGVDVVGSLAYVADDSTGLVIIDVSDPSAPTLVGTYDTPGYAYGVTVVGSLAYVADHVFGLQIIDVSDPSAPTLVGSYDTPGTSREVVLVGSLAYVADYYYGLQILDVSTPSSPTLVGTYDTPGYSYGVTVVGSLAYVADESSGLQILDISTPSSPTLVSTYDTPGKAYSVAILGTLACVADDSYGLQIIDVSDPSAPFLVATYDTPGKARDVVMVGSLAYVADDTSGLRILNINDPALDLTDASDTGPINSDDITDDTTPTFSLTGSPPYVRIYRDGVQTGSDYYVPSVTLPEQPYGTFDYTAQVFDAAGNAGAVSDPLTVMITVFPPKPNQPDLVTADDSGISDTDNLTNVTTPTIRIEAVNPSLPMDIYRSGVYLGNATLVSGTTFEYTFTAGQLQEGNNVITARSIDGIVPSNDSQLLVITLDTHAPVVPWLVGSCDTPGSAYGVTVVGSLAYVADDNSGLQIIDISTPSAPTLVGTYDTSGYQAHGVTVVGSLVYLADGVAGVQIIDVSVPSAPALVNTYNTPGSANQVAVIGSLAYVADESFGMQILDVSDPSAPTLVGSYDSPYGGAVDIVVSGSLAYVTNSYYGLLIIDVSTPSVPTLVGTYDALGSVCGVVVVGSLAYVTDDAYGLRIIDVSTPSAPALMGTCDTPGNAQDVTVVGSLAYVADVDSGLQIIDVSNPSTPWLVGALDTPGYAYGITIDGSLAYVADGPSGLRIIDIHSPALDLTDASDTGIFDDDNVTDDTTPTFDLNGAPDYVRIYRDSTQVSDDYAVPSVTLTVQPYGTFDYTVQAVDAAGNEGISSDPLTVTIAVFPPAPLQPDLVSGDDSGVSDTDNITNVTTPVIRIEAVNPALPMEIYRSGVYLGDAVLVSGTTFEYTFTAGQLQEFGNVITARTYDVIVPSYDSPTLLITLDTLAPTSPYTVGTYDTPGQARGVTVVGSLAYVADGSSGLQIIDVSTPSAATLVGSYNTPGFAHGVTVVGSLAYVADDDAGGLQIIDVSNPSAPTLVGSYDTPGDAYEVVVVGSLAYVADYLSGLQVIDVSTPSAPTLVGTYNTLGRARGVTVVGSLAYVADSSYGLEIIDVSTPSAATLVGSYDTPGYAYGVAVVGSLAYVADYHDGLQVIDVSTPSTPMRVGTYNTPSCAYRVTIVGSLAYVADGGSGLQIIDVSTPSEPALMGSYDTPGSARDVAVIGNLAYVADGSSGLQIIDISNPSAPTLDLTSASDTGLLDDDDITGDTTPTFDVLGAESYVRVYRNGLQVSGDYEAVPVTLATQPYGTWDFTVQTVDAAGNVGGVSDPLTVTIAVIPSAPLLPDLITADDSGVYDDDNLTNVTTPVIRIEAGDPSLPMEIYVDGDYVGNATLVSGTTFEYTFTEGQLHEYGNYITARTVDGIASSVDSPILEIRIDTTPPVVHYKALGAYDTPDRAGVVTVVDSLAYVADSSVGMMIIDVSDPSDPTLVGTYGAYGAIYVMGSLAYVAADDGLHIVDVSDPSAPTLVDIYETSGGISCVIGSLAYLAGWYANLTILDISTPEAPTFVGTYDTPGSSKGVAIAGSFAYVADAQYGLQIIDVSDPSAPTLVATCDTPSSASGVAVSGSFAYVADDRSGLQIIDISTPESPTIVAAYDTPGYAYGVTVVGTLAYVSDFIAGLHVIDVSDPLNPMRVGTYYTASNNVYSLAVVDSMLYVTEANTGLLIMTAHPTMLDLTVNSDGGFYNDDNVTDDTTPAFLISGFDVRNRIYRDSVQVSGDYEHSTVILGTQPYGVFDYTAVTMDTAGNLSMLSHPLSVTIYAALGDATFDTRVDGVDLAIWQQHYDPLGLNDNTFSMGDWNGDGFVDGADLALWQSNYDPLGMLEVLPTEGAVPAQEPSEVLYTSSPALDEALVQAGVGDSNAGMDTTVGSAEEALGLPTGLVTEASVAPSASQPAGETVARFAELEDILLQPVESVGTSGIRPAAPAALVAGTTGTRHQHASLPKPPSITLRLSARHPLAGEETVDLLALAELEVPLGV